MNPTEITILSIALGIVINVIFIWWLQKFRQTDTYRNNHGGIIRLLKWEESVILKIQNKIGNLAKLEALNNIKIRYVVELILIGIWALFVGREYLDFNRYMWPVGREFGIQVVSHNFWNQLRECGVCALWNGSINGGSPALADPFGSTLHPLVMITTLLFGIVNGVKIATIITLWIAGIAQWLIAYILDTRSVVRLWSSTLAIVGGHLIGKLELGAFGILLSTTMASLTLAAIFYLKKTNSKRAMFLLAITITMLLLSGHGYMQVGVLSWMPVFFFLLFNQKGQKANRQKKFIIAVLLGFLLAGLLIVPFLQIAPHLQKWADNNFDIAQPIEYIPINLIVHDWEYYTTRIIGKPPFPYLTNIYIGWIPVLLAILTLYFVNKKYKPFLFTLYSCIFLSLFLASAIPFRWVAKIFPYISGLRHTQLIAGLMVPPIIGLASYSLEQLLQIDWPSIRLTFPSDKSSLFNMPLYWLLLVPLIWSIYTCYSFNNAFIKLLNVNDIYQSIDTIHMDNTQWFAPPFGEHWWILASVENDMKVTNVVAPWWLKDRNPPEPYLLMERSDPPAGMTQYETINSIPTYINKANNYAYIDTGKTIYPCQASATGGNITAICDSDDLGELIVKENKLPGWKVWRDGKRVNVYGDNWLTVKAPSGKHVYTFRYLPWDVPLGLVLSTFGIFLSIIIWCSPFQQSEGNLKSKDP